MNTNLLQILQIQKHDRLSLKKIKPTTGIFFCFEVLNIKNRLHYETRLFLITFKTLKLSNLPTNFETTGL